MPDFSFRLKFIRAPHTAVNIAEPEFQLLAIPPDKSLTLRSANKESKIADSKDLVLYSSGWTSEQDAACAGARYRDALMFACAHSRVGVDFGNRPPRSVITRAGLEMLEQQTGSRVLNDVHGLMVYETEPKPRFASFNADFVFGTPLERFQKTFQAALERSQQPNDRERLAFELFNSSFFQRSSDTRLLVLVMAIECLLEPNLRSQVVVQHLDQLIESSQNAPNLTQRERDSLVTALGGLRYESIRQTGRRFVSDQLGSREYLSMTPADFFDHCYQLRSRLVHGSIATPSDQELGGVVATLEVFVSDILVGDLRDIN